MHAAWITKWMAPINAAAAVSVESLPLWATCWDVLSSAAHAGRHAASPTAAAAAAVVASVHKASVPDYTSSLQLCSAAVDRLLLLLLLWSCRTARLCRCCMSHLERPCIAEPRFVCSARATRILPSFCKAIRVNSAHSSSKLLSTGVQE
jgi:hypothetical protein